MQVWVGAVHRVLWMPMAHWADWQVRCLISYEVELLMESIMHLVGSVFLWRVPNLHCCFPSCLSLPVMQSMRQYPGWGEREICLWQHPPQLGKPSIHSYVLTFFHKTNHRLRRVLLSLAVPLWKTGDMSNVILFLLLSSTCTISDFLTPTVCWNFSAGTLDFHKDFLVCWWQSKSVFSRATRL